MVILSGEFNTSGGLTTVVTSQDFLTQSSETRPLFHEILLNIHREGRPDLNYDLPEARGKVSVWAGLCGNGRVLGPFFYDFNLTGEAYANMLNEEIVPQMMEIFDFNLFGDALFENVWWFQDGAPPHRRNVVTGGGGGGAAGVTWKITLSRLIGTESGLHAALTLHRATSFCGGT